MNRKTEWLSFLKGVLWMKYYAVRRGNKPGIYTSSKEFKESIKGFDNPEYRVFRSEIDAEQYIVRYKMRLKNNEVKEG